MSVDVLIEPARAFGSATWKLLESAFAAPIDVLDEGVSVTVDALPLLLDVAVVVV